MIHFEFFSQQGEREGGEEGVHTAEQIPLISQKFKMCVLYLSAVRVHAWVLTVQSHRLRASVLAASSSVAAENRVESAGGR